MSERGVNVGLAALNFLYTTDFEPGMAVDASV